jgi:sugar O-acyltransferase (sialic acid O-acetyltransferase NeuD family)
MKKAIIGSGGFGREVYFSLPVEQRVHTVFFVDDKYFDNTNPLILPLSKFDVSEYEVCVAIGDSFDRKKVVNSLPEGTKFFTHVHESVIILDKSIKIGKGSIICAGSVLTTGIEIGDHCHLNLHTTIGHDSVIGDYFTTAPGTKISGNCNIGDCVYFGTNSSTKQKINVCDDVVVGLNAGVVKNITQSGIYIGSPAIKIKDL